MDERTRRGLRWLALQKRGFTAVQIAAAEEVSLRTIWYGIRRARDFLDYEGDSRVRLLMQGVSGRPCEHPRTIRRGDLYYCLDCTWSNDPDDRKLWWEKKAVYDEATETAKEVQPKGTPVFTPHIRKPKKAIPKP